MCQIKKTRIKIGAKITVCVDAHKITRFAIDNWRNEIIDMVNSGKKAEIDPINVELAESGIDTKTSLADNIHKTCPKWAIVDFNKYSDSNLITLLIMNR